MAKAKSAQQPARPIDRLSAENRAKVKTAVQHFIAYATQRRIAAELSRQPLDDDDDQELEFLPGDLNL